MPAVPYAPADRLPRRREGEARRPRRRAAAGGGDRRRDRRDARRHPHDRADPRARRARLRGRGRRHRRRRRPAPAGGRRARGALLRGDGARGAGPARPGRDPGRGPLRPRPRHRARPGRRRRDAAQPDRRDAAGRPATTPSWPPTPACAAATTASRRWRGRRSAPSTARPRWCSRPSPAADRSLLGARRRPGADRALGARRRRRPLRSRQGGPRRLPGRDQGPLRRAPDPREGRRPARRELPAGAPQRPPPAPAARRRRPRGGGAARRGSASTRPSSAGSRARTWPAPTPAPTSSSSARRTDTYGQVVARGRRPAACRSSRSPRAARRRWSRTATRACSAGPTPTTSPARCCSSPPRRCCAAASAARRRRAAARALLGAGAGAARAPATGALSAVARPRGRASRSPGPPEARRGAAELPQYDGPIDDPALYFNRELSWLDFNQRVLELAEDPDGAAAGAGSLLRDLRLQPGRVLHGPGRRPLRPARRRDRRPRPRRARRRASRSTRSRRGVLELDQRLHACFDGDAAAGAGGAGDPHRLARDRQRGRSGARSTPASTSRSSRR